GRTSAIADATTRPGSVAVIVTSRASSVTTVTGAGGASPWPPGIWAIAPPVQADHSRAAATAAADGLNFTGIGSLPNGHRAIGHRPDSAISEELRCREIYARV